MSERKTALYCSFCGKSDDEVEKMIAGPTVFICDQCLELCYGILKQERERAQRLGPESPLS